MNIFMTDPCPQISAYNLCYKHVVKMILECAQMLSTTHRVFDNEYAERNNLYKKTHYNHPCSVWCRESAENYTWLYTHMMALGEVYQLKSGRVHKTIGKLSEALSFTPVGLAGKGLTEMPPAIPDEIKGLDISLFDKYKVYLSEKYKEWASREKPLSVEFPIATPKWFV